MITSITVLGLFTVPYYGYGRILYGPKRVFPARTRTVYRLTVNSHGTVREIKRPYYGQRVLYILGYDVNDSRLPYSASFHAFLSRSVALALAPNVRQQGFLTSPAPTDYSAPDPSFPGPQSLQLVSPHQHCRAGHHVL